MKENKMDREKVKRLVDSLIEAASNAACVTVIARVNSFYYSEAMKKRDELRDEIITYLVDSGENDQEIKYPLKLCIDLLHFSVWGSEKTKDKTAYEIKEMLLNFFTQEEIDEALRVLKGEDKGE